MLGNKKWFLSKTLWGGILATLGFALNQFGFGVSQNEIDLAISEFSEISSIILQIVGILMVFYGRLKAKEVLK